MLVSPNNACTVPYSAELQARSQLVLLDKFLLLLVHQ